MQKFTRPITREIEVAGERLAVTLTAEGISARLVGSRKLPHELRWDEVVHLMTRPETGTGAGPSPEDLRAAVEALRKGGSAREGAPSAAAPPAPVAATAADVKVPEIGAVLARLEKWLAAHRRHYLEGLNPGASPAELEALQSQLTVPVPDSLRALLSWRNGQKEDCLSRFEEGWIFMTADEIASAKQELDAEAAEGPTGWQAAWVPFLDDDDGDYVCLDTSQPRVPVREFWQDRKDHPIVSPSLAAWLKDKVEAMEQGDYHEDPERGFFLRAHPRPLAPGERTPTL